ncbi:MAG: hypothetical protein WC852_07100 [Candidatus Nanoarchaeia archaeon]|jgi:hypothetical protein
MDFQELYFTLEKMLGDNSVTIPIIPEFSLDNVVEGSFLLRLVDRPKQELAKGMIRQYILGEKAKEKDVMLIVLTPDAEKGSYGSPVAVKSKDVFYDEFPENIDLAVIYCIERCVFDSLYGKAFVRARETAFS